VGASTFDHARRAGDLLGEALGELVLAQAAAIDERASIGPEFGALRWRAASLDAALAEAAQHVQAAKARLP
jgi:hypothetical protein